MNKEMKSIFFVHPLTEYMHVLYFFRNSLLYDEFKIPRNVYRIVVILFINVNL